MSSLKANRTKEQAYNSNPDFDADFNALFKSTRDAKVKITAEVSDFVGKSATGILCTLATFVRFMDSFGTSREETKRRYQEAADLFQILPKAEEDGTGSVSDPQPQGPAPAAPAPAAPARAKKLKISAEGSSDSEDKSGGKP